MLQLQAQQQPIIANVDLLVLPIGRVMFLSHLFRFISSFFYIHQIQVTDSQLLCKCQEKSITNNRQIAITSVLKFPIINVEPFFGY